MEYSDDEFFQDLRNATSGDQEAVSEATAKLQSYSNDFPIISFARCLNLLNIPQISSTILTTAILLAHSTITPNSIHPINVMRDAFLSPDVAEIKPQILENSISGLRVDNSVIRSTCALIVQILFQIEGPHWESLIPTLFNLIKESPDESSKLGALEALINIFNESPPPEILEMFISNDIESFFISMLASAESPQIFSFLSKAIVSLLKYSDLYVDDNFISLFQVLLRITDSGIEEIGNDLISLIGYLTSLRYQYSQLVKEQILSIIERSIESGINNYVLGALNAIKEISAQESNLKLQRSMCERKKKKFDYQIFDFSQIFLNQYGEALSSIMVSFQDEAPPMEIPEDSPGLLCEEIWVNWVSIIPLETKEKLEGIIEELHSDEERWANKYCILQFLSALSIYPIEKKGDIDQYLSDSLPFLLSCCESGSVLLALKAIDVIEQSLTNFRVWGRDTEAIEAIISMLNECAVAPPEIIRRLCILIQAMAKHDFKDDPSSLCGVIFAQVYEILMKYNEREDADMENIKHDTSFVFCDLIENAPNAIADSTFEDIYQREIQMVREVLSDQCDISFSHIITSFALRSWVGVSEHAEEMIGQLFGILEKKASAYEEAMKAIASVIICTKKEQIIDKHIPRLMDYLYEALHSGSPSIIEPSASSLGSLFRNKFELVQSYADDAINLLSDIWHDQNMRQSTYISIIYCIGDIVRNYENFSPDVADGISRSIIDNVNYYVPHFDTNEMINEAYDLYYAAVYALKNLLEKTTNESWREAVKTPFLNILVSIEQALISNGLEFYSTIGVIDMMCCFGEVYGLSGAKMVLRKGRKFLLEARSGIIYHQKSNNLDELHRRAQSALDYLMNLK